jgi:predicted nucleic acid-binding protein
LSLWVLDASVLLASEDPEDSQYADARRLLRGTDSLATLDLALYEVTNVAVRAWRDLDRAHRLRERAGALGDSGGLVRADVALLARAADVAERYGISAYDAAYVAATERSGGQLVSCNVRDLVSRGLARLPGDCFD